MPAASETGSVTTQPEVDVAIVGAGFAGLYFSYKATQMGFSVQGFEAAAGVGGTWYWNRYPGARCDVESLQYSYSFSPELEQEWAWTERYAPQPEILSYAEHVADRFDLRRHFRFSTRVASAHWDQEGQLWGLTTEEGDSLTARYCVMATGCLSVFKDPDVVGLDQFEGEIYATGRWPHQGVDFTGKRVAVIGTGSSGIQSIPLIAEQASSVTVFQRTPNFTIPAHNRQLHEEEIAEAKQHAAERREAARHTSAGILRMENPTESTAVSADEMRAAFQTNWDRGGLVLTGTFSDLLVNPEANRKAAEFVHDKIRSIVKDPELAETLSPRTFPLGTKRLCVDTNYYATFNQPHVRLVNLRKTPIEGMSQGAIRTTDETFQIDALVLATGFDAMTGALERIDIVGEGGQTIKEHWDAGPTTYLGLMCAGFPNLFMITGPGSPSVLSNMMVSIEQHVEWISALLGYLRDHGKTVVTAEQEAEEEWTAHVGEVASVTLFPQANSWYMGRNVPGKPQVFMPYVGGVGTYREVCDGVAAEGYRGLVLAPA